MLLPRTRVDNGAGGPEGPPAASMGKRKRFVLTMGYLLSDSSTASALAASDDSSTKSPLALLKLA